MKLLLVAPEIGPPWTEGRKRFVADLGAALARDDEVELLTSVRRGAPPELPFPCDAREVATRPGLLLSLLSRLRARLRALRPDVLVNFPHATFRRHYGVANRYYMRRVESIGAREGCPCLTVMYAIDAHASAEGLARVVENLATGERAGWAGPVVDPGIAWTHGAPLLGGQAQTRRLLFMAGMWQPTPARVEYVLATRGLRVLLRAGDALSAAGVDLTVASPVFEDPGCRRLLSEHPDNAWQPERLHFAGTVTVPEAYRDAALFVFPYASADHAFVPTSVVESMFAGTPVVLSDIPLLAPLAGGGETAYSFRADDPHDLARAVLAALADPAARTAMAARARTMVAERWSIGRAAGQVRQLATELAAGTEEARA